MILSVEQSKQYYIMASTSAVKFDPEEHKDNLNDSFCVFLDSFNYEHDAIAKDPPDVDANMQAAWVKQNKSKIFLVWFASRNLQKDYEDAVIPANRSTMTFSQMVTELKNCHRPTRDHTLAYYKFHKLHQKSNESVDLFVNKVKHEVKNSQLSCKYGKCTGPNIFIPDQIIIGTSNDEIFKNALKSNGT